jgi:SprT-like protein
MPKDSLSIYQLRMYAKKWLKEIYGLDLIVPLDINGRLKITCGRFISRGGHPLRVEMNKFFVENNDAIVVLDVLRHELVHYALFMKRKPNSDGHPVFENELKRLNIVSQKTIDKYIITSRPKPYHYYKCASSSCGRLHKTKRALNNKGLFHRCKCGGKLIDKGKKAVSA